MPLFRLANLKQMYLRAYVTAEQLEHVTLGQEVSVYSDMGEMCIRDSLLIGLAVPLLFLFL